MSRKENESQSDPYHSAVIYNLSIMPVAQPASVWNKLIHTLSNISKVPTP